MIGHSSRCVILRRSVANEKGPIAGLRKQELAHELAQDAVILRRCLPTTRFCQRGHAAIRRKEMRINPAAFLVEPDIEKTLITPGRGRWLRHLLDRILFEKFARRGQWQLIFRRRQNHVLKENWSLKPPMAEEFGIERHCHNWIPIISLQTLKFGDASLDKMMGMPVGRFDRARAIVNLFRTVATGNAMIFNSGKAISGERCKLLG